MRAIKPCTAASLVAMTTRQLLSQLSRLRECQERFAASDLAGQPLPSDYDPVSYFYFKDDPRWQQQYADVKSVLAEREHVARSEDRRKDALRRKKGRQPRKKAQRTKAKP